MPGRQVLHDLAHEDAAEGTVLEAVQVFDKVSLLDVEAFAAGVRDHVRVGVDAPRLDARLAQQHQQLAATAADVEDRCGVAEVLHVGPLPLADSLDAAAHAALEGEVIGQSRGSRLRSDGDSGRSTPAGRPAPLEPHEALLELAHEPLRLLAPCDRRVRPL